MTNLKQRLALLEGARAKANIKAMSDEALDVHIRTLTFGTAECYSAIVARVLRHPSVFSVVKGDPAYWLDGAWRERKLKAGTR